MSGQMHFLCLLLTGLQWTFLCAKDDSCPKVYRRFSKEHTFCKEPNSTCEILSNSMDQESMETILNEHNRYRDKVAMGHEKLPSAANMMQFEWDEELAKIAQKHGDQCEYEHDCHPCRQTKNFEVGQNLYIYRYPTGPVNVNWKRAIKWWYDERFDYDKRYISSFDVNGGDGVIGHFTQLIWAKTWKIGCGFTAYKEGKFNKDLYVCNYGPSGNFKNQPVYETGETCSACPLNSCCGETCGETDFPGLCKITDDSAPRYKQTNQNAKFFCNFEPQNKCSYKDSNSQKKWKIENTLSGPYIGVILKGGESATLNITNTFSISGESCLLIRYRKGPNVAGEASAAKAIVHLLFSDEEGNNVDNFQTKLNTDDLSFYKYKLDLNWKDLDFQMSFDVSVPAGKPSQYFEVKDLAYSEGSCS